MDLVPGVEGVQVLGIVQVPQHRGTVLSTGRTERSVGRDSDYVDVSCVSVVIRGQLAAC